MSKVALASLGKWEVAKGGRSVNAGPFAKIRMEYGRPDDEVHANMVLIAAAPRMLNALHAITLLSGPTTAQTARKIAREAIATAEGGEA